MRVETVTKVAILAGAFVLMACGDDTPATPVQTEPLELVVFTELIEVPESDDPFKDHRPETVECDPSGYGPDEPDGFELFTGKCNYFTGVHVLQHDIPAGRTYTVEVGHGELVNSLHQLRPDGSIPTERDPNGPQPEETTGHVAIQIGDDVVWEKTEKIPGIARFWLEPIVATKTYERGTWLYFHVHNHGANSWRFLGLRLEPPAAE